MKVEKRQVCDHEPHFFLDPRIPFDAWCADCNCINVEWVTARTLLGLKLKWNYLVRSYVRRTKRRASREAKRITKEGETK